MFSPFSCGFDALPMNYQSPCWCIARRGCACLIESFRRTDCPIDHLAVACGCEISHVAFRESRPLCGSTLAGLYTYAIINMPSVGLMVGVVGIGSFGPEFKSRSAVELTPGRVDSACFPSEVGKTSASLLVYCVVVVTRPGLCPIV